MDLTASRPRLAGAQGCFLGTTTTTSVGGHQVQVRQGTRGERYERERVVDVGGVAGVVDEELLRRALRTGVGTDAEQGEVAVGPHDGKGQLFPWKVRQLREDVGDELGLRQGEGEAEEGAPGGEAARPDGRLDLVRERLVLVSAEDDGLQPHPIGEAGGGGHGAATLKQIARSGSADPAASRLQRYRGRRRRRRRALVGQIPENKADFECQKSPTTTSQIQI